MSTVIRYRRPWAGAAGRYPPHRRRYYPCMAAADDLWRRLRALAADQFGLFTAAQARQLGLASGELTLLTRTGVLWRAHHGVYAFTEDAAARHCQVEQSEGDFRRFASAIHQVACDV